MVALAEVAAAVVAMEEEEEEVTLGVMVAMSPEEEAHSILGQAKSMSLVSMRAMAM